MITECSELIKTNKIMNDYEDYLGEHSKKKLDPYWETAEVPFIEKRWWMKEARLRFCEPPGIPAFFGTQWEGERTSWEGDKPIVLCGGTVEEIIEIYKIVNKIRISFKSNTISFSWIRKFYFSCDVSVNFHIKEITVTLKNKIEYYRHIGPETIFFEDPLLSSLEGKKSISLNGSQVYLKGTGYKLCVSCGKGFITLGEEGEVNYEEF